MNRPTRISLGSLLIGVAIAVRALGGAGNNRHAHHQITTDTSVPMLARASSAAAGGSPRQRMPTGQVERAFVRSYLAYLSGSLPASALRDASITARDQAVSGGRIPASFRDGPLEIRHITGASTLYSAQATVEVSSRSESYPFTVQLLREQTGWQVAQLQPPDLSVDQTTRPIVGVQIPRAGQQAAARFATGYANYRAAVAPRPGEMTSTAETELRDGQDPLVRSGLRRVRARLLALSYGPLEQDRFAVTATVELDRTRAGFTVLMLDTRRGWECDAFL